jgi:hypothetical protein
MTSEVRAGTSRAKYPAIACRFNRTYLYNDEVRGLTITCHKEFVAFLVWSSAISFEPGQIVSRTSSPITLKFSTGPI